MINFGLHDLLVLVWIMAELFNYRINYSLHASAVTGFGIIYILLFFLDLATGLIMIVFGAWWIAGQEIFSTYTSSYLSESSS